jgi:hypothetical protein
LPGFPTGRPFEGPLFSGLSPENLFIAVIINFLACKDSEVNDTQAEKKKKAGGKEKNSKMEFL